MTANCLNGMGAEHGEPVLIAGGGPVGLILAVTLASYGINSIVFERNPSTTRWPKMDLTNARSMEHFRRLGIADSVREQGVPPQFPYTVLISAGLGEDKAIAAWNHQSVNDYRKGIRERNDGTQPVEPYQRISQQIFEAWLKEYCHSNSLIDVRFLNKVLGVKEDEEKVTVDVENGSTRETETYQARYLVACDGAASRIRQQLEIPLDGGPVPGYILLVHFKSRDLARLHKQGRFWHIFFCHGAAIISQDEKDTFTAHLGLPLDADSNTIGSEEAVYRVLGGAGSPYPIQIDEILVRSTYRPNIAIARRYRSQEGRVFLAGDSGHQNIPTGGYGMNMGIGDAFNLGWKLAATVKGWAGPEVLVSYEHERRPLADFTIERSGMHMDVHNKMTEIYRQNPTVLCAKDAKGDEMRAVVRKHYTENDGENKSLGIEMGLRYNSGIICLDPETAGSSSSTEPVWDPLTYTPTTWPGSRVPHVFLTTNESIFDLLGEFYTLVDFSKADNPAALQLAAAARHLNVPLKHVKLPREDHARTLWEKDLVLVRPDEISVWRGDSVGDATGIVKQAAGMIESEMPFAPTHRTVTGKPNGSFTATAKMATQIAMFELEKMGDFQK